MGGGLLQLVAYGAQDVYLTGNPQVTLFKQVYKRHTNFSMEAIKAVYSGNVGFGNRITVLVPRNGDLLSKMYIRVAVSGATAAGDAKWAWVKNLGHAIIKSVELSIGGQRIDFHTGDWNQIWHELSHDVGHERGYDKLIGNTIELTKLATSHDAAVLYIPLNFFFCRHIGLALPLIALQYHEVKIDIIFEKLENLLVTSGFASNPATALGLSMTDTSLYCDYIFLDTDERRKFAQASHEYLIEAVQHTGVESVKVINHMALSLNHCVKELIWFVRSGQYDGTKYLWYHPTDKDTLLHIATKRLALALAKYDGSGNLILANGSLQPNDDLAAGDLLDIFNSIQAVSLSVSPIVDNVSILGELVSLETASTPVAQLLAGFASRPAAGHGAAVFDVAVRMPHNFGVYIDGSVNPLHRLSLQLNGHDRFEERDAAYFNYIQPMQHHKNTPTDGLNVYAFALRPEEMQPSGSLNFSRIDTAMFKFVLDSHGMSMEGANISVYALSYNILRIMSGMGGLAFST